MTYKFALQKQKEFGRHSEICKNLRGVGVIFARMFNQSFNPLAHHCYVPQINEESHYLSNADILKSIEKDEDAFRREGKQLINVCINCGQVYEDLQRDTTK